MRKPFLKCPKKESDSKIFVNVLEKGIEVMDTFESLAGMRLARDQSLFL